MTELLFRDDGYLRSCNARVTAADGRGIQLDRTVFYPMGGGQPGDRGVLRLASGPAIAIVDTIKGALPDEVIHVPAPGSALPETTSLVPSGDQSNPVTSHAPLVSCVTLPPPAGTTKRWRYLPSTKPEPSCL